MHTDSLDEKYKDVSGPVGTYMTLSESCHLRASALTVRRNRIRFFNTHEGKRLILDVSGHTPESC